MNVVFISPHFPLHFYQFCDRLKKKGVSVLGIGDCLYDNLPQNCRDSLTEYYYVRSLEDYDEVYRAVAFFSFKYGKIDYIESQNEYWLETEAKLRKDFNTAHGFRPEDMPYIKRKSLMKQGYERAGVRTARYLLVEEEKAVREFVADVGYPVVVKPDNGVGASNTYKLDNDEALEKFLKEKPDILFIMEEFVPGHVETFDGITNADGEILFCAGQVMQVTPLAMLSGSGENISYTQNVQETDLLGVGERVVKAFGTKNRFFHFEFFRLDEDKEGLGKRGDVIGLEVNMRAPGGYIPDKMNFAYDADVYEIWAESLISGRNESFPNYAFKRYVTHFARSGKLNYAHSAEEIRMKFSEEILIEREPPKSISGGMGSYVFILKSSSLEEIARQGAYILEKAEADDV